MNGSTKPSEGDRVPVRPIFPLGLNSDLVVYAGDLDLAQSGNTRRVPGELRLSAEHELFAHFDGPWDGLSELRELASGDDFPEVSLPKDAGLSEPRSPAPDPIRKGSWVRRDIPLGRVQGGSLAQAKTFTIHLVTAFSPRLPAVPVQGGTQNQASLSVVDWTLTLATIRYGPKSSGLVISARPIRPTVEADDLEKLGRRLFLVFGFAAGREVGVGPIAGYDADEKLVWADWISPRRRPGRPGIHWWPHGDYEPESLRSIAAGVSELAADPAHENIIDRAIEYLMFANSDEVLDVRIPIACAGLEILGWSHLRRVDRLSPSTVDGMSAAKMLRRLLTWAKVDTEIPSQSQALKKRANELDLQVKDGPQSVVSVRNRLIHPPEDIGDPEWPTGDELYETWQLSCMYLELVLLRLLGYEGTFLSRVDEPFYAAKAKKVPWASTP